MATLNGRLLVVRASTGQVRSLGVTLPRMQILAVTGPVRR